MIDWTDRARTTFQISSLGRSRTVLEAAGEVPQPGACNSNTRASSFFAGGGCFKISAHDYVTLWRVEVAHGLMLATSEASCTGNRAFKGPAEQY